jgi:hypothetical protein
MPVPAFDEHLLQIYRGARYHGLAAAPDPALLMWSMAAPAAAGCFLRFHFLHHGALAAWGLARVIFDGYIKQARSSTCSPLNPTLPCIDGQLPR